MAEASATQTDWGAALINLVTPVVSIYQQKKLVDVNAQRAAQGLPPLDAAQAGMAAQAQVGLDKSTRNLVVGGISAFVLVGLGVAAAMMRKKRR